MKYGKKGPIPKNTTNLPKTEINLVFVVVVFVFVVFIMIVIIVAPIQSFINTVFSHKSEAKRPVWGKFWKIRTQSVS